MIPRSARLVPAAVLVTLSTVTRLRAQGIPPPDAPADDPPPAEEAASPPAETAAPRDAAPPGAAPQPFESLGDDTATPYDLSDALSPRDKPYWRTNLFKRFFGDQKFLLTTWWPSEFKRFQFTGPLLAGVALSVAHGDNRAEAPDLEFQRYVQVEYEEGGGRLAKDFSFIGNAGPAVVLLGAGYLIGRWGHQDRLAEASSLSAEALLSSGLYCTFFKKLTSRTRPTGGSTGDFFSYNPEPGQVTGSFPSGHATGAFTVATVFAETYKDHPWVGWVAYGTAGMVGWSRLAQGRHFAGDVIVGGLLGHSIGRMVATRGREEKRETWEFEPYFDPAHDTAGVMVSKRW